MGNRKTHIRGGRMALLVGMLGIISLAGQPVPDFLRAKITVAPDPGTGTVAGEVRYEFRADRPLDSVVLDAYQMEFEQVLLDGAPVGFRTSPGQLLLEGPVGTGLHELFITYRASPRQALYFIGWNDGLAGNEQVWTQGQGKDNSHWVPVVDHMEEKMEFDLSVRFDSSYQVVSNGRLLQKTSEGALSRWDFDMDQPMSSYLLAFAIGAFDRLEMESGSGIPLLLYYPEGETEKARWTYRLSREIFDFLEAEIGVPYPWGDYKQVPVSDFLYAGMENTAATIFSDRYLVDSIGYNDQNYINVNAHELAHQWFGNLVTETDASQHWLHEGFATYYAYRTEMHLLGKEAVYWKLFDTARALSQRDLKGEGESLLDPGSGSLTFYEKGAWALFELEDLTGAAAFRKGIQEYLTSKAYGNARVADFIRIMEGSAGLSLESFRHTWLRPDTFPVARAMEYLSERSPAIRTFLELEKDVQQNPEMDEQQLIRAWEAHEEAGYREHLLRAYGPVFTRPFLDTLFAEGPVEIWKVLLETTPNLEGWMKPHLESWLDAPSYDLREGALFRLWVEDPAGRANYLDRVSQNGSLADTELQQLWWLMATSTESYATPEEKIAYLDRLRETTSPAYPWEVRQNAIAILYEVGGLSEKNMADIVQATEHHSWQFRKFARAVFQDVLGDPAGSDLLIRAVRGYPKDSYRYAHEKIGDL